MRYEGWCAHSLAHHLLQLGPCSWPVQLDTPESLCKSGNRGVSVELVVSSCSTDLGYGTVSWSTCLWNCRPVSSVWKLTCATRLWDHDFLSQKSRFLYCCSEILIYAIRICRFLWFFYLPVKPSIVPLTRGTSSRSTCSSNNRLSGRIAEVQISVIQKFRFQLVHRSGGTISSSAVVLPLWIFHWRWFSHWPVVASFIHLSVELWIVRRGCWTIIVQNYCSSFPFLTPRVRVDSPTNVALIQTLGHDMKKVGQRHYYVQQRCVMSQAFVCSDGFFRRNEKQFQKVPL